MSVVLEGEGGRREKKRRRRKKKKEEEEKKKNGEKKKGREGKEVRIRLGRTQVLA